MPNATIDDVLEHIFDTSTNTKEQGDAFENATVFFLKNDPLWKQRFSDVWLWRDSPTCTGQDTGIDVVARDAEDGSYWAIQCKCWQEDSSLTFKAASTFFASAGADEQYQHYMIVDTVNSWSRHLQKKAEEYKAIRLDVDALKDSDLDWAAFLEGRSAAERDLHDPRPHQLEAIDDCLKGFNKHDRGKCIMACGTGKTLTSLRLTEEQCPTGFILFLAPSISLVTQSMREWANQARNPMRPFVVCSDEKASHQSDIWATALTDIPYPSTTDAKLLVEQIGEHPNKDGLTVIFATYQSIQVIIDAQQQGLDEFDLVICDEAHRTTGLRDALESKEDESYFTKVHDKNNIKSKKRLYMTATPKVYGTAAKIRAHEESFEIASMDDEEKFGPVFHYLSFGEAVDRDLLTDYRVVVMTVTEDMVAPAMQRMQTIEEGEVKMPEAGKMIGCWKGLSERAKATIEDNVTFASAKDILTRTDDIPLHHAVSFASTIKESQQICKSFQEIVEAYIKETGDETKLRAEVKHIDGTMNAIERRRLLGWLGQEDQDKNTCHILSNARCLSEGVDVPNLDAVMFMKPRKSQIDIIQAVGRVMRKAEGKEYGYIILPVFVAAGMTPEDALDNSDAYEVVWQVLQALRSHDERLEAKINALNFESSEVVVVRALDKSKLKRKDEKKPGVEDGTVPNVIHAYVNRDDDKQKGRQGSFKTEKMALDYSGDLSALADGINAQIVRRCGNKIYWADWAEDIAKIAKRNIERITNLVNSNEEASREFEIFLTGLRDSLNPGISKTEAIEMLAQHIITLPVFDVLFGGSDFAKSNPVSIAMEKMVDTLKKRAIEDRADKNTLADLYDSVRIRAQAITTDAGRQKIIKDLYENFFSKAFKSTSEKMGIVYTPNEVVDYILYATDRMLKQEFGQSLGSKGVHILDPFAGTGTFMANLITSDLISDEELPHKYAHEMHSNEIMLLAYYIMTINIEYAYHSRMPGGYQPFEGAVLTDTFQMTEANDTIDAKVFADNSKRVALQNELPIRVIVGNPPYSVGQRSANDNNMNESYPSLDKAIANSYVVNTNATNKNSLYDSYIRAFRWASDRIGDAGIICYVSNAGWLDGQAMDGFRKCLSEEFSSIYVFDLRGNQRTQGDESRREGGKIFGSGSRAPIAITMLIKNPSSNKQGQIFYHDIGDCLSREDKLSIIHNTTYEDRLQWNLIRPDKYNDWLNQRDDSFYEFAPMGIEKLKKPLGIYAIWSRGIATARDTWLYNFSSEKLLKNASILLDKYNLEVDRYKDSDSKQSVNDFVDYDDTKIKWNRSLLNRCKNEEFIEHDEAHLVMSVYRPFCKQWLYNDVRLEDMVYQQPKIFPEKNCLNKAIVMTGPSSGREFSCLITDCIPDLHMQSTSQAFPQYWYESKKAIEGLFENGADEDFRQHNAITNEALEVFQHTFPSAFDRRIKKEGGNEATKDDIFFYIYGVLHSLEYRERFRENLLKELPRIPLSKNFRQFSEAGRQLADLHLNYEIIEPYLLTEDGNSQNPGRTEKMRFGSCPKTDDNPKGEDRTVLHVAEHLTLKDIPEVAYRYVVNGKTAIGWLMDRYRVTTDKASGIVNDPNEYSDDPRYIVDLVKRIVRVSIETIEIVDNLPALDEMDQPLDWPIAWKQYR